jgi:hypothetical protein
VSVFDTHWYGMNIAVIVFSGPTTDFDTLPRCNSRCGLCEFLIVASELASLIIFALKRGSID